MIFGSLYRNKALYVHEKTSKNKIWNKEEKIITMKLRGKL
jgi:hypothetical protein